MKHYYPAFTAVDLVVLAGLVHGFWTDRWTVSRAAAEAAARLEKLPLEAGDWQAEPLPLRDRETEAITGHLSRRYVNRSSGQAVTVLLLSGLPGPVAIHTPDVCYKASGFQVANPVKYRHPAEGPVPAADFWTADLHKTNATEQIFQRVFWSWTTKGVWKASDSPRSEYAGEPVLFKLYLVREMSSAAEPLGDDPCLDLMHQLLPQLQKTLFPRP